MRINRVFADQPLARGALIDLSAEGAHHIGTVLRMREGDFLHVFDGDGGCYLARIAARRRSTVTIEPVEFLAEDRESPIQVTLAQGLARGTHMDYTIQKAVELGVRRIAPLLTEHGNVRLDGARASQRMQHWRRIIIGACEQCGRNRLPELLAPIPFSDWIAGDASPLRLVLHPRGECGLGGVPAGGAGVTLLCGPEGGFAEPEFEAAMRAGYTGVRLGPRILRTETAAVAALAACQVLWGDLR
ncbi:MAG: 16S rRNA (uracil(1498)-N(3))-methyltransferase [Gammaproteobacteria bacterium]|nr:16S rRNA (uracil(1498)-N(3))-methyltransferase [Gammaproteobacteria bacterium]